jgi:hypothetical protein
VFTHAPGQGGSTQSQRSTCPPLLHLIAARHLPNRSGTGADPVQAAHYRRNAAWAGCLGSNLDYRVRFESGAAANTPALMRWRFDDWPPFSEWGYAARKDACRAPPHECGGVESRHASERLEENKSAVEVGRQSPETPMSYRGPHSGTSDPPALIFKGDHMEHGWLCPACRKAHAPSVKTCPEPSSSDPAQTGRAYPPTSPYRVEFGRITGTPYPDAQAWNAQVQCAITGRGLGPSD